MPEFTTILQQIVQTLLHFSWIDWVATISALLYVLLAARGNNWCWLWAIISGVLWAYASYVFYQLLFDALLQVFYVVMAVVGWWQWRLGGTQGTPLPMSWMSRPAHFFTIVGGSLLSIAFAYTAATLTTAAATYWDAFTTVFSVITTFWLVRRKIDNWLYWIFIDLLYAGLYATRGAYLFAVLMLVYTGIAALAFYRWRAEYRTARLV